VDEGLTVDDGGFCRRVLIGFAHVCSNSVVVALDAIDAALDALFDVRLDTLDATAQLDLADRLEAVGRRQRVLSHDVCAAIGDREIADIGGVVHRVIADRLRVSPGEVRRRMRDAEQLRPRVTLTGLRLAPELAGTADQWRAGALDGEHLKVLINQFAPPRQSLDFNT
jgi:hypothetical protein